MKLTPQDWQKLRYPIIGLGAALISMTLLVGFAEDQKNTIQQKLQHQENQLSQARQRYQTSGQEKEIIIKFLPLYQQLIKDGFIGEERRIEWVDTLRNINQQNKLFGINYSIGMQEEYKPKFALNAGSFILHRSIMKLELPMLHEGDLFTAIDALAAQQTTPFMLRDCEIKRQTENVQSKLVPNLVANCELDWLTMLEPKTAGNPQP